MAKQVQTKYKSQNGRYTRNTMKDTSVLSGRQQVKLAKLDYKAKTQKTRLRAQAIRSASANLAQAVTGITGAAINKNVQSETTKRLLNNAKTAANQATNGGLTESSDERDEDKKDETNPWVY